MSFDDYANHIYQKHRLAVALAIIKSKPPNVTTDEYLEELKSKVDNKMNDDDITVCSDDFLMEDDEMNDSVTILKDFDPENVINENVLADDSEQPHNMPEKLSQITYYDSSLTQSSTNITEPVTDNIMFCEENLNNEHSMLKNDKVRNFNTNNESANTKNTKIIVENTETVVSNSKLGENNENTDATYYDSQKTVLYTLHGFTQNYTHYSPSQTDIVIPNKYIYGVNKNKDVNNVQNKDMNEENFTNFENDTQFFNKTDLGSNSETVTDKPMNKEFEYIQTMNMFSQSNDDNFEINNGHINSDNNGTMNNINVVNKGTGNTNTHIQYKYSQNTNEIQIIEENDTTNNFFAKNNINTNDPEIANTEITDESFGYNLNIVYLSQNIELSSSKKEFEKDKETSKINDTDQFKNDESNAKNITQNSEKDYQLATVASENDTNRREEEEHDSEEIISYKVLEEFNKVKTFLNRQNRRMSCDGYSSDSGYRSDSQIRSSNRSALQLSGNWLNQSGCCLFNYIMQCPLVASTRDITNEIAQVLSQLIDRLHEDEKYPSFLEDLLETVDLLLRQIYEGESSEDNEFLKKDENIQRILLLNKSIHIQKHSIEKMSNILETFHTKVTEIDSTYELVNIDEIENISYIFHILEILLKKYLKNRELLSQTSTQNSQDEEKIFKKSSITDIWRKKWNPSQKTFEGSREKKCVLKDCSEILNKIVVNCVSSYSLIAYSALKCFNSMQS